MTKLFEVQVETTSLAFYEVAARDEEEARRIWSKLEPTVENDPESVVTRVDFLANVNANEIADDGWYDDEADATDHQYYD